MAWFGVWQLPDFVPVDKLLAEAIKPWHERTAMLMAALVRTRAARRVATRSPAQRRIVTTPAGIRARLPAAGAKPRRELLRGLILERCALRALIARELAAAPKRTEHKPLVRDCLSPMVRQGMTANTVPEMEHYPEQRYTLPTEVPTPSVPSHCSGRLPTTPPHCEATRPTWRSRCRR